MTNVDERTGLEILTEAECEALIPQAPIGRVVFVDEKGQPLALPVNFRWQETGIVFRTLEGQKMRAAVMKQPMSFEVDRWDPYTHTGWSVLVKGRASLVEDWAEMQVLEGLGDMPWADEQWRASWIRVTPMEITGRRVS